jgi:hypothetical protein
MITRKSIKNCFLLSLTLLAIGCSTAPPFHGGENLSPHDREKVRAVVVKHLREYKVCYEHALEKNSALEGTISLKWDIDPAGEPRSVKIIEEQTNVSDGLLRSCYVKVTQTLRFSDLDGSAANKVTEVLSYPFFLTY